MKVITIIIDTEARFMANWIDLFESKVVNVLIADKFKQLVMLYGAHFSPYRLVLIIFLINKN